MRHYEKGLANEVPHVENMGKFPITFDFTYNSKEIFTKC